MSKEAPKSRPVGRPTKYKKEYCQKLVEHMRTGLSYEAFAGALGVAKETIYAWERKHAEFMDAKKRGFAECQLFWEKMALEGMWYDAKRPFNTGVWIFNMKNRFKWTDKVEVETESLGEFKLSYKLDDE